MSYRAQKWNVGLEHRKERETFCGCFRKRTPFLRWRTQLKTGYETERSEMERWTGTPEGTRDESCGRFGKRTPFLRGRVQLTGCEQKHSHPKSFRFTTTKIP